MTDSKVPARKTVSTALTIEDSFQRKDLVAWGDRIADTSAGHKKTAFIVFMTVFVFGGLWAAFAELGGAVVASGRIIAEDRNRIVQHFEGGILAEVTVREGDEVKAGDVIARLDPTQVEPRYRATLLNQAILRTELERYRAEIAMADTVTFTANHHPYIANSPELLEAQQSQKSEFLATRRVLDAQLIISENREKAASGRILGQGELLQALEKQAELYKLELRDFRELLEKGLIRRTQVFETERRVAEVDARIATTRLEIAKAGDEVISFQNQQEQYKADYLQRANTAIVRTQKDLNNASQQAVRLADMFARLDVMAPTDAIVLQVAKRSIGEVISPGDALFELFPIEDTLTLEVFVQVTDIEQVFEGQDVSVVFPSNREQAMLPVPGKLTYLSADATVNETNPAGAYRAFVKIDPDQEVQRILPGNVAEVYIKTEPMTLLEILARPITRFTSRAFTG